jgi:hypothetical protein
MSWPGIELGPPGMVGKHYSKELFKQLLIWSQSQQVNIFLECDWLILCLYYYSVVPVFLVPFPGSFFSASPIL